MVSSIHAALNAPKSEPQGPVQATAVELSVQGVSKKRRIEEEVGAPLLLNDVAMS